VQSATSVRPATVGDVLTIGFATAVAMWGFGYFAHLPDVPPPSWLFLLVIAFLMVLGGAAAGLLTNRGWKGGLYCGLLAGALNLLVLGGILTSGESGQLDRAVLLAGVTSLLLWQHRLLTPTALIEAGTTATAAPASGSASQTTCQ